MTRRHRRRFVATLFVAWAMLFSQFALAFYACPAMAQGIAMAGDRPCGDMDSTQPVLCHQHGVQAATSFEPLKAPVAATPMIVQVLVLAPQPVASSAALLPRTARAAPPHPPPEPVFLATLRLRV